MSSTFLFRRSFMMVAAVFVLTIMTMSCSDKDFVANESTASKTVVEINANIEALRSLVNAEAEGTGIVSCVESSASTYDVELEDGKRFYVRTALDPLGGKMQYTSYYPLVSIEKHDGEYCWTVDGKLIEDNGQPLKVADDSYPSVSIDDDGYWSADYGTGHTRLSKVENGTVRSVFAGVDIDNESEITFRLRGLLPAIKLRRSESKEQLISPTYTLRRPITPEQPAWLVHIDAWNNPDPQAIIDLVPEDLRPYVIFNIAFSTTTDDKGNFTKPADAYSTAKSWLSVCAANRVWAMVQPSSGGVCHWPDYENYAEMEKSVFCELFRKFPNFLGFNYAEQGWGFGSDENYLRRLRHFANLLRLSNKYGGYLTVSFYNPSYGSANSGVAMIKRSAPLAEACRQYGENFIVCEKFTQKHSFHEMESTSLGVFLSGFAGNYGIRFDESGWYAEPDKGIAGWNGDNSFPPAAGAVAVIEHMMLTGQTVMDGPELVRRQCFSESSRADAGGGYTRRTWKRFGQFENISMDIFRKILDGTLRILTRKEVTDRTKVVVVNDISPTGATTFDPGYAAPATLFKGLYLMDEDGTQGDNHLWFKRTGRYPAIPTVAALSDEAAQAFTYKVNASAFQTSGSVWGDIRRKQEFMNTLFPEEYTGDGVFAAREENRWVVYNPYSEPKTGYLQLKYNTCSRLDMTLSKYSTAIISEQPGSLGFYLTNYTADRRTVVDRIQIRGCKGRPSFTFTNRISGNKCEIISHWSSGVLTLTITHNGALDINVTCSGTATGRLTASATTHITKPAAPDVYNGTRQYEAECFDYRNIGKLLTDAAKTTGVLTGFSGMGYLEFGQQPDAAVRETITAGKAGRHSVNIRYCAPQGEAGRLRLLINGKEVETPVFSETGTGSDKWRTLTLTATLSEDQNTLELKTTGALEAPLYIDYVNIGPSW